MYCLFLKEGLSVAQVGLTFISSPQWARVFESLSLPVQRSQMPLPCLEEHAVGTETSLTIMFL